MFYGHKLKLQRRKGKSLATIPRLSFGPSYVKFRFKFFYPPAKVLPSQFDRSALALHYSDTHAALTLKCESPAVRDTILLLLQDRQQSPATAA